MKSLEKRPQLDKILNKYGALTDELAETKRWLYDELYEKISMVMFEFNSLPDFGHFINSWGVDVVPHTKWGNYPVLHDKDYIHIVITSVINKMNGRYQDSLFEGYQKALSEHLEKQARDKLELTDENKYHISVVFWPACPPVRH